MQQLLWLMQTRLLLRKERAIKQSKAEMADLAISMASKLVEKNVDATTNKKLIDDFLSEAGDTQ